MTRKLFTSISLSIAIACLAASPVQAKNHMYNWDTGSYGIAPYVIAGGWQVGDLAWIPLAVHDVICGG